MGRFHSYLNSALQILGLYKGDEPFASFLKKFFATDKKYGSKDRKYIGQLCYCWFRTGKMFAGKPTTENILAALFLCSKEENEILENLEPGWNPKVFLPLDEKCLVPGIPCSIPDIFPFKDELSDGIPHSQYCASMLVQPDLYLRIRPGMKEKVMQKLDATGCSFSLAGENCMVLPNATKVEDIIELNKEAVVQDYSSQRVGEFLQLVRRGMPGKLPIDVWDCCAASGGKSILAKDILGDINLTVSDVRESIIINLRQRFKAAVITGYKAVQADLTAEHIVDHIITNQQSVIIADVPCTGSGTWSRTPEQLYYFKEDKTAEYAALQRKIVTNVIPSLAPGGYLLYITCSVFKKENEEMVAYIKEKFPLQLVKMELLKGYDKKADTMFAALLQKSL